MSTTPTLREAAQTLLGTYMFSPVAAEDAALHAAVDNLRAALTKGAGAAEPVAHLWRNVIDGRPRVVMPDSIITADASWVVEDSLHTATQLQQAVARALEELRADLNAALPQIMREAIGHPDLIGTGGVKLTELIDKAIAAAIRAKGTHQ